MPKFRFVFEDTEKLIIYDFIVKVETEIGLVLQHFMFQFLG